MFMDIVAYMSRHNLTDADIDRMAEPYEAGDYPHSDMPIHHGSPLATHGQDIAVPPSQSGINDES